MRRRNGTWATTEEEIGRELMNKYFPRDEQGEEGDYHVRMREESDRETEYEEDLSITSNELEGCIESLSKGKAPGMDGVPNECMRSVREVCGKEWLDILNEWVEGGMFPDE